MRAERMEVIYVEPNGLIVALQHVDNNAGTAFGTQLPIDVEQTFAHLVSFGNPVERNTFVVAYTPKGSNAEAIPLCYSESQPSGIVAVIDVYLLAPSGDGRIGNLQLSL